MAITERQKIALDLIRKRGDEGTLVRDVMGVIKDDVRVASAVLIQLWKKGLIIKKRTFGIVEGGDPRFGNNRRTQKLNVWYPAERRDER